MPLITADHVDERRVFPKRIRLWREISVGFLIILSGRGQHLPAMTMNDFPERALGVCTRFTNDHRDSSVCACGGDVEWRLALLYPLTCPPSLA